MSHRAVAIARTTLAGLALAAWLGAAAPNALAQQLPPVVRIYGSLTLNGANAAQGAVVTALTGATTCGTSTGSGLYDGRRYFVDIDSSQPACAAAGAPLSFQVNGQKANETARVPAAPGGALQVNLSVGTQPTAPTVTYQPGWNLVSGPGGTTFSQAAGPLYYLSATTGSGYATLSNAQGVAAGQGYWALFNTPTSVPLSGSSQDSANVTAPAGQWVQIGNPSATKTVTVAGADVVYTYTPSGGYQAATQLPPGQGAWAYSAAGASISIR